MAGESIKLFAFYNQLIMPYFIYNSIFCFRFPIHPGFVTVVFLVWFPLNHRNSFFKVIAAV